MDEPGSHTEFLARHGVSGVGGGVGGVGGSGAGAGRGCQGMEPQWSLHSHTSSRLPTKMLSQGWWSFVTSVREVPK